MLRPALAVALACEQLIDHARAGFRGIVRDERRDFLGRRRQTREIEADATQPIGGIRGGRGLPVAFLELREDEGVHG